jgi:hypothetical protein
MSQKSVAEIIVETLAAAGVKRIYGVVGDSLNGMLEAGRRVVARAFVTGKSVSTVELVPLEVRPGLGQRVIDDLASGKRNMRVLPTPDEEPLGLGFSHAGESVVLFALTEAGGMEVGGI